MPDLTLNCDVYSYCKGRECYGKAGDPVTLVGLHDDVMIVQNSKGVKFPVHSKKVTKGVITVTKPPNKEIPLPAPAKRVKEVATQTNLF